MNILVCIKQVPDTTEIRMDPKTNTLIRAGVPSTVNPFDKYALEAAVQLRETLGGTVTAMTMGPAQAAQALAAQQRAGMTGIEEIRVLLRSYAGLIFTDPAGIRFSLDAEVALCNTGKQHAVINRPPHRGPDGHRRADRGGSSVIKNNLPALGTAGGWDIRWRNKRGILPAQMLCILRQVRWSGFPRLWQPIDSIVALQSAAPHFRAAKRTIQTNLLLFRYPQERDLGKPSVFPVLSPAAKEDLSIIFGRTCACRKFPAPGAWGAVHQ